MTRVLLIELIAFFQTNNERKKRETECGKKRRKTPKGKEIEAINRVIDCDKKLAKVCWKSKAIKVQRCKICPCPWRQWISLFLSLTERRQVLQVSTVSHGMVSLHPLEFGKKEYYASYKSNIIKKNMNEKREGDPNKRPSKCATYFSLSSKSLSFFFFSCIFCHLS